MACEHNVIPCNGGLRRWFRNGFVCVRCDTWFRKPPRTPYSLW